MLQDVTRWNRWSRPEVSSLRLISRLKHHTPLAFRVKHFSSEWHFVSCKLLKNLCLKSSFVDFGSLDCLVMSRNIEVRNVELSHPQLSSSAVILGCYPWLSSLAVILGCNPQLSSSIRIVHQKSSTRNRPSLWRFVKELLQLFHRLYLMVALF